MVEFLDVFEDERMDYFDKCYPIGMERYNPIYIHIIINKYNVLIGYIILINSINFHIHGLLLLIIPKSPPKAFLRRVEHTTTTVIINS